MGPIPRHYGACAVAPGIIKKEHATWVYASNPTMAAAPDCSLHTARREGEMEGGPHEEPSRSGVLVCSSRFALFLGYGNEWHDD
ncbi:unnamed protein product [Sphagnum jensenii]